MRAWEPRSRPAASPAAAARPATSSPAATPPGELTPATSPPPGPQPLVPWAAPPTLLVTLMAAPLAVMMTLTPACGAAQAGAECGNGVVERGEECDNGTPGLGACTQACTFKEWHPDTAGTGSSREPAVAMSHSGDFVVVWQAQNGSLAGGERLDVYAALYSANGAVVTPAFRVNKQTALDQVYPSVGMDDEGRFVVAWYTVDQAGVTPTDLDNVYLRAFAPDGAPVTGDVQVNTWTDGPHLRAHVGVNGAGDMVVAWGNDGQDGDITGVFAQMGDSTGNLLSTPPFQVNTVTADAQANPHVGISSSGEFVIAWESKGQEAT